MNARFDDAFQLEMMAAAGDADALVCFNRLWDAAARRGLRRLGPERAQPSRAARGRARRRTRRPPRIGTGNVCSGRVVLDYARAGCESVALHTFFQLPLARIPRHRGHPHRSARCTRCCSTRSTAWWPACWSSSATGVLHRRGGELRFLDLVPSA